MSALQAFETITPNFHPEDVYNMNEADQFIACCQDIPCFCLVRIFALLEEKEI